MKRVWFLGVGIALMAHPLAAGAHVSTASTTSLAAAKTAARAKSAAPTRVSMAAARATALARTGPGKVRSQEYEKENGRWIYSFDIALAGKPGTQEVQVDAHTGAIISVKHETPKAEQQERRADAAQAKKAHKKSTP